MEKYCQECGQTINGRADKRFCSDACRTTYNNLNNRKEDIVRRINRKLQTNRAILIELCGQKSSISISKMECLSLGLDLNYFTHAIENSNEKGLYEFIIQEKETQLTIKKLKT